MPATPKPDRRHAASSPAPKPVSLRRGRSKLAARASLADGLRVGIICSRQLCGTCLRGLLEQALQGAVTRVAASLDAVRAAFGAEHPPQVIVYSAICPYGLDLDGVKALCAKAAPVPVIVHLDLPDTKIISKLLRRGVKGVLPTSMPSGLAIAAVQLVAAGGTYAPPPLALGVEPRELRSSNAPLIAFNRLTPRQTAVLRLATEGKSNKEIGRELGVGENTIKFHIAALMQKLRVNNRVRLAVVASRLLA